MADDLRRLMTTFDRLAKAIEANTKATDRAARAIETAARRLEGVNADGLSDPVPADSGPTDEWAPEILEGSNRDPGDES